MTRAIRSGREVATEHKAGRGHLGVAGEERPELLSDVHLVQPDVRQEDHHGVFIVLFQDLKLGGRLGARGPRTAKEVEVTKVGPECEKNGGMMLKMVET